MQSLTNRLLPVTPRAMLPATPLVKLPATTLVRLPVTRRAKLPVKIQQPGWASRQAIRSPMLMLTHQMFPRQPSVFLQPEKTWLLLRVKRLLSRIPVLLQPATPARPYRLRVS